MATIGQQLKAAREAKGVSESEAGKATKILTKLVVSMEADDFSCMAAPTYARGFIRLYAKYLGIDPESLVEQYNLNYDKGRPPLVKEEKKTAEPRAGKSIHLATGLKRIPINLNPKAWTDKPAQFFSNVWKKLPSGDIRMTAAGAAGLIALTLIIVSITNCARRHAAERAPAAPVQVDAAHMLLDEPLPDLYLVEPGKIESNP
jgi:transcriptional regulator with XRE-family HTH domain